MKLMIASALARDTKLLMMDEPASPLDPLMRDCLCSLIREYLAENEGENSVFFSTHNIADMENVTDYAIIMERGRIVEEGFVEDLKEKYVYVKGEPRDIEAARNVMFSMRESQYGCEGVCLAEKLDQLAGCDVSVEQATQALNYYAYLHCTRTHRLRLLLLVRKKGSGLLTCTLIYEKPTQSYVLVCRN